MVEKNMFRLGDEGIVCGGGSQQITRVLAIRIEIPL